MSAFAGSGPVALGVHDHRLVEHPHPPLERGGDVVARPTRTRGSSTSLHGAADHVQVPEPGELPRAPAGADQAGLLVEDEERGVRGRVVVVEQLEQEAEAAFLARPCARFWKPAVRSVATAAIAAVGADEDRHWQGLRLAIDQRAPPR